MNPKEYIYTAVLFKWKPYEFINAARNIKWRYVILHFVLISCLLYLPLFFHIVRTQPDELYSRVYSGSFENAQILYFQSEDFNSDVIDNTLPAIYVFRDVIVYADPLLALSAPSEFFGPAELALPFGEIFSMLAVYNLYIPQFLLPMLLIAFGVMFVLQFFFYLVFAAFFGLYRMASTRFPFRDNVKITIMSSFFPALICTALGFILPAVHIILFQLINILILFYFSKRYDKREKELEEEEFYSKA
ncbi:MAG: hypothetical protein FWD38_05695 [Oscillospiraceae bacterium]|nr:hypothetical protein [Oscillospiraceae bacterium]